ncbi:MAG: aspartate dehydrogenase [Candidatus Omnitrophota bacterium]
MANKKMKVGIIGCGTIGTALAEAIEQRFGRQARLVALSDIDSAKAKKLRAQCVLRPPIVNQDELIKKSDLIIEAAAAKSALEIARNALARKKDILLMSIGGILENAEELFRKAEVNKCRIYLPSGAIGGLDAVKAAAISKITHATLITRKPPQGLAGAPYLKEHNIDVTAIKDETVIFEGTAAEAVKGFPQNVNVCALLSLAGIGPKKTRVRIIADPHTTANSHEIEVAGDFGRLWVKTENLPSPANPKTSILAFLSAIATLQGILGKVKIGT